METMRKRSWSLYSRILMQFLIILLVPFVIYMFYGNTVFTRAIETNLLKQGESAIREDGNTIAGILDHYRHKAYEISTSPILIESFSNGKNTEISSIYSLLFSIMKGDTYKAAAHIISLDGKTRLSTHIFPEQYDTRIHGNEWETGSILTEAYTSKLDDKTTLIYAGDHRMTDEGNQIFASILRRIYDDNGKEQGFVIIDIFTDAVIPYITGSRLFSEEVLVDSSKYTVFSLVHPNKYGSFERFPDLQDEKQMKVKSEIPGFSLIGIIDTSAFAEAGNFIMVDFGISFFIGLIIVLALSLLFSHSLLKRLDEMKRTMKYIEEGNLNLYLGDTGITDFDELAASFNSMVTRIIFLLQSQSEEQEKLREAERKSLESQLNPHFIFNTLSTIKAIAKINGEEEIYTIALQLGKLLRSSLKNDSSESTIKESLDLTESYLKIQKIRYKEKLEYTINYEEALLDTVTPKLIIQPLVENAVVHGMENSGKAIRIGINIREENGKTVITIDDNGDGSDVDFSNLEALKGLGHVGIYNIHRRLQLKYMHDFTFEIRSTPGDGTHITIKLPIEKR